MTGETVGRPTTGRMVPTVWLLTHRYNSRIFQNKSVGGSSRTCTRRPASPATGPHDASGEHNRDNTAVQYRETDYKLHLRLMEEEGIWWCFEQSADAHTQVLADSSSAYAAIEGGAGLPNQPPTGMNVETEHVFRFRWGNAYGRGGAAQTTLLRNTTAGLKPRLTTNATRALNSATIPANTPASRPVQSGPVARSGVRVRANHGVGQSNCYRLAPGRTFRAFRAPSEPANRSYLLTAVLHQGRKPPRGRHPDPTAGPVSSTRACTRPFRSPGKAATRTFGK
jgi:type VI secretion system secreted protein VgrG